MGDSYTIETELGHRVYLVDIGNSIRVRSYGGRKRKREGTEREERGGRGRDSSEEGLTERGEKRDREYISNSLAFVQPKVSIHSDVFHAYIPSPFIQSSILCADGASNLNCGRENKPVVDYEQQPPGFPEIIWESGKWV